MDNIPARQLSTAVLLLVPTPMELELVREFWPAIKLPIDLESGSESVEIMASVCGFGLVTAAARTAILLSQFQPKRVLLLGIAGTYRSVADVGQAIRFDRTQCYGIGAGTGDQFQSAEQMGWLQWQSHNPELAIGDRIDLGTSNGNFGLPQSYLVDIGQGHSGKSRSAAAGETLLSVTAASDGPEDVQRRKRFCPEASAEDMEGFAVAAACCLAQVPLTIVRGISNLAGDRNKANWRVRDALELAVKLAKRLL